MNGFVGLAIGIAGVLALVAVLGILVGRYLLPTRAPQVEPRPTPAPPPLPYPQTITAPVPVVATEAPPVDALGAEVAADSDTAPAPMAAAPLPRGGATAFSATSEVITEQGPVSDEVVVSDEVTASDEVAASDEPDAAAADLDTPTDDQHSTPGEADDLSVEEELRSRIAHLEMEFSRLETGAVSAWDRTMPALQQHIETLEAELSATEEELQRTQQALADSGEQIEQLIAKNRPTMGGATRA